MFMRPLMLVVKAMVLPSGDHDVPPMARVMNSFSTVNFCTSALGMLLISAGSVMNLGMASCCARVSVLIQTNITKQAKVGMMPNSGDGMKQRSLAERVVPTSRREHRGRGRPRHICRIVAPLAIVLGWSRHGAEVSFTKLPNYSIVD